MNASIGYVKASNTETGGHVRQGHRTVCRRQHARSGRGPGGQLGRQRGGQQCRQRSSFCRRRVRLCAPRCPMGVPGLRQGIESERQRPLRHGAQPVCRRQHAGGRCPPDEDSDAFGTNGNQLSNAAANSGAVYVYQRTNGTWAQTSYVKASNTQAGSLFGSAGWPSPEMAARSWWAPPARVATPTGANGVPANFKRHRAAVPPTCTAAPRPAGSCRPTSKATRAGNDDRFGWSVALVARWQPGGRGRAARRRQRHRRGGRGEQRRCRQRRGVPVRCATARPGAPRPM